MSSQNEMPFLASLAALGRAIEALQSPVPANPAVAGSAAARAGNPSVDPAIEASRDLVRLGEALRGPEARRQIGVRVHVAARSRESQY